MPRPVHFEIHAADFERVKAGDLGLVWGRTAHLCGAW